MNNNEALDIIGGLSKPSKMPWYSWSISATVCKTGTKLRDVDGSTCSDCYAMKGMYRFKNVKVAHDRRLACLSKPEFVEAFILVLTNLYNKTKALKHVQGAGIDKENRFRWHDSGDLQDLEHLDKIVAIAKGTPFLMHWLPSREYGIVNQWLKLHPEGFPSNLTVRMSATMIGVDPKVESMGLPYSTVGVDSPELYQCPAPNQGGICSSCDTCWRKDKNVNYHQH